jgi:hypothetical protein
MISLKRNVVLIFAFLVLICSVGFIKQKTNYTHNISGITSKTNSAVDLKSKIVGKSDSYDINVTINCKIALDDKVKGVNPNIIRATRQALFNYDCNNAMFWHYNGFTRNYYILIFDVKEISKDTWAVKFHQKQNKSDKYDTDGYSFAMVVKQKSGVFIGRIDNPGGPKIDYGETY